MQLSNSALSIKICQNKSNRTHLESCWKKGQAALRDHRALQSLFVLLSGFSFFKTMSLLWVLCNRGSSSALHLKEKKYQNQTQKQKTEIYPNFTIFPCRFVSEKLASHINLDVSALRPFLTNIELKASIPLLERNPTQSPTALVHFLVEGLQTD